MKPIKPIHHQTYTKLNLHEYKHNNDRLVYFFLTKIITLMNNKGIKFIRLFKIF